jgi:hypothetical protein
LLASPLPNNGEASGQFEKTLCDTFTKRRERRVAMKYKKKILLGLQAAAVLALSVGSLVAREPENFGRVFYKTGTISSGGGNFGGAFRSSGTAASLYYRCASRQNGQIIVGPQFNPNAAQSYAARCDNKTHQLSVPVRPGNTTLISMVLQQQGTGALSVWALK